MKHSTKNVSLHCTQATETYPLQEDSELLYTLIEKAVLEGRVAQIILNLPILIAEDWHTTV